MTKHDEIETLRTCAHTLGADSYCGPWLLDQIPAIESDIRADLLPMLTYSDSRLAQEQMREQAKADCERMLAQAKKEADQIRAHAEKFDRETRVRLAHEIQKILETL